MCSVWVYIYVCMYVLVCVCIVLCICVLVCYVYVCVYTCMYGCTSVRVYICVRAFMGECVCVSVAAYGLARAIRTGNRTPEFVFAVDPIHWRFEGWHTRWFGDPYRFVQWRPDSDLDPKSRHFMWVFAFVLFSYLPLSIGICILLVLFHVTIWYILPVWLPVSLHEASVGVHFNFVVYRAPISVISYVDVCHFWLRTIIDISYTRLDLVIDSVIISDYISPIFFIWCQLVAFQLSDTSSQLLIIQLSAIIGIVICWRYSITKSP